MKLNDMFLGLLLVAAAIGIWISAQDFSRLPNQAYGSETMPLVLSGLAMALGLYLIGRSILAGDALPRAMRPDWAGNRGALGALLVTLALIAGYIALAGRVGFVPVAVGLVLILMLVMRVRWWVALPMSIVATIVVQQAFARLLLVPLPRSGFLGFLW